MSLLRLPGTQKKALYTADAFKELSRAFASPPRVVDDGGRLGGFDRMHLVTGWSAETEHGNEVCNVEQALSRGHRKMTRMINISSVNRAFRLAVIAILAAVVLNASAASAQTLPSLGSASTFAVLGGPAVTCTASTVTGDVGVLLSSGLTNTGCTISGTVHAGDAAAAAAYAAFLSAYMNLASLNANPTTCDTAHTLTGLTLAGLVLSPGVYCVDATAKTGLLTLNAAGDANAVWIFLVNGALTGTNFNVTMLNGGQPCNVFWWVNAAATLTTSSFLGTVLAGAAVTVTGGTLDGRAFATAAATLTGPTVAVCSSTTVTPPQMEKCEDHHDRDHDHDKDHGGQNQNKHFDGDHCDHERGVNGHHKGDGCEHERQGK
jgi:hypothetical protein